ncbi:MAG TPA: nuclear transport factor 2 family protein [Pyrinomonadaceae bacterium]|jgi:ketosteroid isomerase-like protein
MKIILLLSLIVGASLNVFAQSSQQKIYDTEKAFEKAVAEKGMNRAFIDFSTADGLCFMPGYPVGCIEYFKARPASPAALFWNPTFIDVSSNGALAYSTGNSVYKPKGKDDAAAYYGEYATVWMRQPDGGYKAVLDIGISHEQPNAETNWTSPADSGKELNEKKFSAADSSTAFFEMSARRGLSKAYKTYFADDVRILRDGKLPIVGKPAALREFKNDKSIVNFAKRSVFVGAADMAYITNGYTVADRDGKITGKGNFLQIWKLRNNKWQIVFDVFLPAPPERK